MKTIASLKKSISRVEVQLQSCFDADRKEELESRLEELTDELDEIENDVDPEDVYGILGHADSPSLDTHLYR